MFNEQSLFDSNGYIAVSSFLSATEIKDLDSRVDPFIEHKVPQLSGEIVYYEDKDDLSTLKQIQKLNEYDSHFEQFGNSPKVVGLAEELLGGEVQLQNMQYFNKVPRLGRATPAHQDGYYFMIKPQAAVTMWLSLGQADASNGAVCYIPGSHKKGIRPHCATGTLGFSQGISDWSKDDDAACVQMEAGPGDMLVHHSLMIHSAAANKSNRDRKSIGLIFYRSDVEIDTAAHAAYQEALHGSLKHQRKI